MPPGGRRKTVRVNLSLVAGVKFKIGTILVHRSKVEKMLDMVVGRVINACVKLERIGMA